MTNPLDKVLVQVEGLTRDSRAAWRESGRPAELLLPLPSGVIVVLAKNPYAERFLRDKPGPYRLALLSESGSELAAIEADSSDAYHRRLEALYTQAKAKALDLRQRIGQVESELALIGSR